MFMFEYITQHISEFFQKFPQEIPFFLISLGVGLFIQIVKICIDSLKQKKFTFIQFFTSGGFPSSHAGIASSLTTIVLLHEGIYSVNFAIAFTFSLIVAYDAMNVRYQSGEHAKYLNELRRSLHDVLSHNGENAEKKQTLKERLGHTPFEVVGWMLFGIVITFILYYTLYV